MYTFQQAILLLISNTLQVMEHWHSLPTGSEVSSLEVSRSQAWAWGPCRSRAGPDGLRDSWQPQSFWDSVSLSNILLWTPMGSGDVAMALEDNPYPLMVASRATISHSQSLQGISTFILCYRGTRDEWEMCIGLLLFFSVLMNSSWGWLRWGHSNRFF